MQKKSIQPLIILVVAGLVLFNCERNKDIITGPGDQGTGNTQDYLIYSTILNNPASSFTGTMVISDSTAFWDIANSVDYIKEHAPDIQDKTIKSYLYLNQQKVKLLNIPNMNSVCHMIDNAKAYQWKDYYPDAVALIHVSRVGFNSAKDQALVYFSDYSAPLCASGHLVFLVKTDNAWVIKKTVMMWIS